MSQPTVSRYLNGRPISDNAYRAIEEAIASLGYRPNRSARSLATNRSDVVGVVVGDIGNAFYAQILEHVRHRLAAEGFGTLMVTDRGDELERLLGSAFVDGIIVTTSLITPENDAFIHSRGLPVVSMNHAGPDHPDIVVPDNAGGASLIAQYLLDLGHTRFGVITGPAQATPLAERLDGFRDTLGRAGISLDFGSIVMSDLDSDSGRHAAEQLLHLPEPPTALFTATDVLAYGALNAASSLGLRVPEDVAIGSFDDLPPSSWELIRLTTVRQPLEDMADAAVSALLARLAAPDADQTSVTLPCELVIRRTA